MSETAKAIHAYLDAMTGSVPRDEVRPVISVPCFVCHGSGSVETGFAYLNVTNGHRCATCAGTGHVLQEVQK